MGTAKDAERKILLELTDLLLRNAERVIEGETKVCLTTSSLETLVSNFRRYSTNEDDEGEDEGGGAGGRGSGKARRPSKQQQLAAQKWRESMKILLDFVMKIKALKIINSASTLKAPIQLARFSSLCVLEVKKVPVHMLEGLSRLRGQLKEITVAKSLQDLQGLLEICGGDRASGLVWSCLTVAVLSFNGITALDPSLRLVPFLAMLDLSHNSLKDTGIHLTGLTDVVKMNLGFNLLSKVPDLSMLNKGKLQTLVLRNNNLDNLDGVEELVMLEELDVSENCFLDHSVLQVLPPLNRLRMLHLVGNPICYKSDHRYQTLKRLSPHTAMNIFILDGQRMTQYEVSIVRTNSQYFRKSITVPEDDCDGMETIVVSHKGGSKGSAGAGKGLLDPGAASKEYERGRKRGHRRVHSKERRPIIGNIQESMSAEHSRDTSPEPPARDEPDFLSEVEKDRQHYEILREHYKDDWLKALTTGQGLHTTDKPAQSSEGKGTSGKGAKPFSNDKDGMKSMSNDKEKVDGGAEKSNQGTDNKEPVEVKPIATPVDKPDGPSLPVNLGGTVHISDDTDLYARRVAPAPRMDESAPVLVKREDLEEDEAADSDDQYGEESEPLIVMLPDSELKQIFITVNNRYILEKDTNGKKLSKLDLKSLQSVQKGEEELRGDDIVGGQMFTVLTLDFDYVKKDMRRRRYAMEDDNDALVLESLIYPYLKMKEEQAKARDALECLKCKHQFSKRTMEDLVSCPRCKSKMVIKVEEDTGAGSTDKPTVDTSSLITESRNQESTSSYKKSPALVRKHPSKKDPRNHRSGSDPALQKNTSAGSLSEYVEKMLPVEDVEPTNKRQGLVVTRPEVTIEEVHQTSANVTTAAPTLQPNSSWTDMQRILGSQRSQSATRSSISSVESDITVLATNSRGSVGIISESSYEVLECGSGVEGNRSGTMEGFETQRSGVQRQGNGEKKEDDDGSILAAMTSPGAPATPVGSPLSNSVCSSMVSSVYENTLPGVNVSPTPGSQPGGGETYIHGNTDNPANILDSSFTSSSSDSVSVRHSSGSADSRSRRSKHRNAQVYSSENENQSSLKDTASDFNKSDDFFLGTETSSIYDTATSRQTDESSLNSTNVSTNSTFPSIYDKGTTDSESEKPSDSDSFLAVRPRSRDTASGSSSSPQKRSGNRSRSRSANRSAIYGGDSLFEESGESHNTSGLAEFPSDLSPIKKVPGKQGSEDVLDGATNGHSQADTADIVLRRDKDDSVASGNSGIAGEKVLPWEQEDSRMKAAKHESLIHDEFVNIDHRIQLFLELHVLRAEELIQCAVQCPIVQYMIAVEVKSLLVITSTRILILRINSDLNSEMTEDSLKLYEDQPISHLQYVDIGLGYQSLRLEFSTECSSFTLLLCDEARCKQFLTLLSDIAQTTAIHEHSHLEGISKSNPTTLDNLQKIVMAEDGAEEGQEEGEQVFVRYLLVRYLDQDSEDDEGQILGLIVTTTDLILVRENHQWPLPRLQAPLSPDVKGQQFTVLHREKINNIEQFAFNEEDPSALKLTFFECSDVDKADNAWYITMETTKGVKSLVDAIREPWEAEFGVSLDVTSTSFTDDSINQQ